MLGKVSKPGTLAPVTRQQSLGSHGETQRTVNHAWGGGRGGILDDQDWSPWPSPPPTPAGGDIPACPPDFSWPELVSLVTILTASRL